MKNSVSRLAAKHSPAGSSFVKFSLEMHMGVVHQSWYLWIAINMNGAMLYVPFKLFP
jgi:hypothetical protein